MSILDIVKKVKIETLSFEKHPCKALDEEIIIHYLNGLALVAQIDKISDKRKEYLEILLNSFELSEEVLESCIEFAKNPDEKMILNMMQAFVKREIKYNFIIDALMIAGIDGEMTDEQKTLIQEYMEMFKLTKKEQEDLIYLYEKFYHQDGNALFRYFRRNENEFMKEELFYYLIDYYKIDFKYELQQIEKKLLKLEFFKPSFPMGSLGDEAKEIMSKPVNNELFALFLNDMYLNKKIEKNGDDEFAEVESKDLVFNPKNSKIEFKNNRFIITNPKDLSTKATGMTLKGISMFIQWIEKANNEKYKLSSFTYDAIYMNDFKNPIFGEFYYSYDKDSHSGKGYYCARLKFYNNDSNGSYFSNGYHRNSKDRDIRVDDKYNSDTASFRLMRL